MAYKVPYQGGSVSFTPSWHESLPEGTTIFALIEQSDVGSVAIVDGKLVFTPNGTATGNAYISVVASLPSGYDAYATILIHVTDALEETTNFGSLQPE